MQLGQALMQYVVSHPEHRGISSWRLRIIDRSNEREFFEWTQNIVDTTG